MGNIHFESTPRHVTPQINCLGKTSPVLRVSIHIYGISMEIDGENAHFSSKPKHVTPQIDHLRKMSPLHCCEAQPISGVSPKICTINLQ